MLADKELNVKSRRFLEFLEPEKDGFHLYNSFGMARCDRHDGFACTVPHISFAMDMSCPKLNVSGQTSVAASFGDFTSSGGGTIQFDVDKFRTAAEPVFTKKICSDKNIHSMFGLKYSVKYKLYDRDDNPITTFAFNKSSCS